MLEVARIPVQERATIIELTSAETGLPEAIVEKDFWVCYLLDYLFQRSEFAKSIVFKGGTSLSKAYGLIERFSEDVDLILDWRLLGYDINEPWEERSNSQQEKFKQQIIERTNAFLSESFAPSMRENLSEELGFEADVRLAPEEETVLFAYPRTYSSTATLDSIRLEIGPLAAWTPSAPAEIASYIAEANPQLFTRPSTVVETAVPERTFWEKATILHQEANRPQDKKLPRRYARHYYDMYQLGHSDIAKRAMERFELLDDVVTFKEKFYRTPWAKLAEATSGTLKLVPPADRIPELDADYLAMRPMIFGETPAFEEVIRFMAELQDEVNGVQEG